MRTARVNILKVITISSLAMLSSVGCSAMKNGPMTAVTPVTTTSPRVGTAYLLRGWIGIFSTGIDKLGEELNAAGVHSQVFQEAQWSTLADTMIAKYENQPNHEPIVLVGHSYGADDSIAITRKLAEHNIKVDLVVTLDPVTPPKVPANIARCYNLYQSSALDALPFLRGIPLTAESPGPVTLLNQNIRTDRKDLLDGNLDHFNIEKKEKIHADVIAQVLQACPERSGWVASRTLNDPSRIDIAMANRPAAAVAAVPMTPSAVAIPISTASVTAAPARLIVTSSFFAPTSAGGTIALSQSATTH